MRRLLPADLTVSLVEFGSGDAQRSSSVQPGRSDDDVDIASEGHQKSEKALQRILAKLTPKQSRQVRS